ncbi:MAG TPA: histidine phosphatase family protein [Azospirillaceae bacterium]|nr:histidine phosphatase family protein [Azospirillaceae bacterium]
MRYAGLFALLVAVCVGAVSPVAAQDDGWRVLRRGGAVALIRHAQAPGTGDPPGFRLDVCATQRNLSEDGRRQARRLGAAFAAQGVRPVRVLSSAWCRALETARLAFGEAEIFAPLNSFFAGQGDREAQTNALRSTIAAWRGRDGTLVLVTHQVNITALTGVFPREGEVIVLRLSDAGFDLAGRIPPPEP